MARRAFDVIAFDGDDTLWHNERSYQAARRQFHRLLAAAGVDRTEQEIDEHVDRIELRNLGCYGYGVSSFVLSLIESAIDLTGGRVAGADLRVLTDLAKQMLTEDVELLDGAREAVTALSASHPLMLITKGDLLHQTSKLDRSGLRGSFRFVEVVSTKTAPVYASILARHGVDPSRVLMVGNSMRSDVLPVIELGGWAVHVQAALSWSHEDAELPEAARARYRQLSSLTELAGMVRRLEGDEWQGQVEDAAIPRPDSPPGLSQ